MQRARGELLAGARLTFDEHGAVGGCRLLEQGEAAPHHRAAAEQQAEALVFADVELLALVHRRKLQLAAPHQDARARRDQRLSDAQGADKGAVGAAEIAEQEALLGGAELELTA